MKLMTPFLSLVCSAASLQGASLLVAYDFEGSSMLPSTTTDATLLTGDAVVADAPPNGAFNSTETQLRRWFFTNYSSRVDGDVWGSATPLIRVQADTTDLAAAVANDSYFSVSLQAQQTVNLTELTLDIASGGSYTFNLTVRSSLTGNADLVTVLADSGQAVPEHVSIDLSEYSVFGEVSDEVTFYFYLYNESGSNLNNVAIDNISFYGAAVPEPASAVLLGMGACGVLLRRRRGGASAGR